MSRDELVAKGRSLGVERPELMTRVELGDEIVRRTQSDPNSQRSARGWLGIARDLVASVVESGLNLPDAAAVIRGGERAEYEPKVPAPVATVTLAEIYATQGHVERALNMLDEVLEKEPEHPAARALRERLREQPVKRVSIPRANVEARVEVLPSEPPPVEAAPAPAPSEDVATPEGVAEAVAADPPAEAVVYAPPAEVVAAEPPVEMVAAEAVAYAPPAEVVAPELPVEVLPPPVDPAPEEVLAESVTPERPAATEMLAEPALLVLRMPKGRPLICWELQSLVVPALGVHFEIECLGFVVVNARPERREMTLQIEALRGSAELSQFDEHTVVRAALGYRDSGAFVPVAIGTELSLRDDAIDVSFRPPLAPSEGLTSAEHALVQSFAS
jgi:hypothetical protein